MLCRFVVMQFKRLFMHNIKLCVQERAIYCLKYLVMKINLFFFAAIYRIYLIIN